MAKINAEYDTVSKELKVSKDGELMVNVHNCAFNKYGKEYGCHIMQHMKDEDNDMYESYHLEASKYNVPDGLDKQINEYLNKQISTK